MTEEEKEAIKIVEDIAFVRGIRQDVEGELEDLGAIEDVLRLIDKLQKENEELEEMLKNRISYTNELEQDLFENASNYVVSKDKIRDKIKELDMQQKQFREDRENKHTDKEILYAISVLESLLEGELI